MPFNVNDIQKLHSKIMTESKLCMINLSVLFVVDIIKL